MLAYIFDIFIYIFCWFSKLAFFIYSLNLIDFSFILYRQLFDFILFYSIFIDLYFFIKKRMGVESRLIFSERDKQLIFCLILNKGRICLFNYLIILRGRLEGILFATLLFFLKIFIYYCLKLLKKVLFFYGVRSREGGGIAILFSQIPRLGDSSCCDS